MGQRDANLLWLRDLLEHLTVNQQQLQLAADGETIRVLTDNMLRDLECCRRLCETLGRRAGFRQAV
jgi:hypothetical protein